MIKHEIATKTSEEVEQEIEQLIDKIKSDIAEVTKSEVAEVIRCKDSEEDLQARIDRCLKRREANENT